MKNTAFDLELGIAGFYRHRVMNSNGTPATDWSKPHKNLVLPGGYLPNAYISQNFGSFYTQFQSFHAGSGSTPNSAAIDGTYSQTGTTVSRATGTGTFVSGNVGDFIKFTTGERAKIISITNTVTVEVDRSQTVAATGLTIYDTSRTLLDTWVKATTTNDGTAGASGSTTDSDAGTRQSWQTKNFAAETVAKVYTEIGVSPLTTTTGSTVLFSRVLLDAPVSVEIEQFLQIRFDLVAVLGNYRVSEPITMAITGWPYPYNIQSIVSNGTYWDVLVGEACSSHYAVGRPIIIAGAVPATSSITAIVSTVSDFTVTTGTAHGKIAGNSIVIAGSSVAGYNGTWTVLAAPTGTTLTVTSGANLGAATGGTLRLTTPGTWYDGTYTIASFPTTATIRITNATSIPAAGIAGTVKNSMAANAIIAGLSAFGSSTTGIVEPGDGFTSASKEMSMITEANMRTGLTYGTSPASPSPISVATAAINGAYDSANRKRTFTVTFPSANQNSQTIRQILIGKTADVSNSGNFYITFDERQRKNNGYQLVLNYTVSWEPDLS